LELRSITRWALPFLGAALLVGCRRPGTSPADAGLTPRASDSGVRVSPEEPVLVKIEAFDCARHDEFPGEPPASGPISAGAGIRAWRGGGPYGSNWNVDQLRCVVRATAPCTQGRMILVLRVGQRTVAEREAALSRGATRFEVVVPAVEWERGYDSPPGAPALALPFRTAAFRAQVVLECEAPTRAGPRDSRYPTITTEETFVAGFASGE
jgi:hypothetical protein